MDFLLEIGGEELPATFISSATESIKIGFERYLLERSVPYSSLQIWGTPRRLTAFISDISTQSLPRKIEVKGPPKKVAYDNEDKPTPALLGFLQGQKGRIEDVDVRNTTEGDYIFLIKEIPPVNTKDILTSFLPSLIKGIKLLKAMRWDIEDFYFSRPIRWMTSLLGDTIVSFQIGNLTAGRLSRGHRFFGSEFTLENASSYKEKLKEQYVLVDTFERKEKIREELERLSYEVGGKWDYDENLLNEVTFLVEFPQVLRGNIPLELLSLPSPLIATVLKHHLKAFPLFSSEGKSLPYFLFVSNNPSIDSVKKIIEGYEHVAVARLRDAHFFYKEDISTPLIIFSDALEGIAFMEGLGSLKDKSLRLFSVIEKLPQLMESSERNQLLRILSLLKFDQATQVVKEFPELEGVMAKEYSLIQGEDLIVAEALYEDYLPRGSNDKIPTTQFGKWVSLLDRLDSLTGLFSLGYKPTGSEDPYGLRRYAMGVVRILLSMNKLPPPSSYLLPPGEEKEIYKWEITPTPPPHLRGRIEVGGQEVDIDFLLENLLNELKPSQPMPKVKNEILKILLSRLEALWLEEGYRYDNIRAILGNGFPLNLVEAENRLKQLEIWYEQEEFIDLVLVVKRIQNIMKGQKLKEEFPDPSLFKEPMEEELYRADLDVSNFIEEKPLNEWLGKLSSLGKTVDSFFDKVLVMTPDEELKINRLLLIGKILKTINILGDLSQITVRR